MSTNYPGSPFIHVDENPQEVHTSMERAPGAELHISLSKECPSDQPGMFFSVDGWLILETYSSRLVDGELVRNELPDSRVELSPEEVVLLVEVFKIKGVLGVLATVAA